MSVETPILFLVFNRPDVTERVFQEIRKARPKQLFIAADGPRPQVEGEAERCRQVREIVSKIDWDCIVKTNFRTENLGCGKAVSGAITWFFEHVESGIILEDDCLPDQTFFTFCQAMLERYENDPRVMLVSGSSFQKEWRGTGSYYFSKLAHIWGWATWRRVWAQYDFKMSSYPQYAQANSITELSDNQAVQAYFSNIFSIMYSQPMDTWDYQLFFKIVEQQGLAINPNKNLISNIGFGPGATHTIDASSSNANAPRYAMEEIVHPAIVSADTAADMYSLEHVFGIDLNPPPAPIPAPIPAPVPEPTTIATNPTPNSTAHRAKRGIKRLVKWIARQTILR